ncbi:MAG TPA: tripartite tricarboxylate transporter substrate binding protein [Xanthobacteraceae bacterium]|jgi:tripartite-type tricarboxylate transporter receptor subunit TctC|nr:tripartite tricarboxylate transporter substrate binding protein [Xanthobacteraceae bacterium]
MEFLRRDFLRLTAGAAMLPTLTYRARAAYPDRPVRLVLPFPPGGVFDIIGRPWADKVKTSLGTVFIDNQPGAGGSIAAQLVAHATPDGYTIFLGSSSIHLAEMILREHPLLDPMRDLVPISMVAVTCFAITVHPSVPVQTLKELIAYIKANPGKLSYGSSGAGTMNHLSGEMFKSLTGITDLPHVPYRGAGPALADVIAGQIPMIIPAMTSQVLEFHRTGKLKLLAITNPDRLPVAPNIPTANESGAPGLVSQQVLGLFAPAGTPQPMLDKVADANRIAMADKAYTQSLIDAAVIPTPDWTIERFNAFMKTDIARWTPLVKAIGVRLD